MDSADTDYSSFENQFVAFEHVMEDVTGNARAKTGVEFEPLQGNGGLNQNEIAELVYYQIQVSLEFEDEEAGDQDVGTASEFRGTLGINLPVDQAFIDSDGVLNQTVESDPEGTTRNCTQRAILQEGVEERILQHYLARGAPPFDDASGPGGASVNDGTVYERNYRQLTGRGPVLDATDDLVLSGTNIIGDGVIEQIGSVRAHLVWDTAEVSDAGRAFSVPSDD
jgi:hypothetical protein